jgi:transcriptional regulator with XRE-family HTH domain
MSEMEWLRTFAGNLQYYLETYGLSQSKLAEMAGLEQGSISRYMSARQMPGVKAIVNIALALGITVDELINYDRVIY